MRTNTSRYALLGLLSLQPMSGYDIKKTIAQSISYFWNESYGQIYPLLKQLTHEGLTTRHTEPQTGKPDRHVYTLTDAGYAELQRWLASPLEPQGERNELLLRIFFGQHSTTAQTVAQLAGFRSALSERMGMFGAAQSQISAQNDDPNAVYWLATLSYGQHVSQALVAWCDETITRLEAQSMQEDKTKKEPKQ